MADHLSPPLFPYEELSTKEDAIEKLRKKMDEASYISKTGISLEKTIRCCDDAIAEAERVLGADDLRLLAAREKRAQISRDSFPDSALKEYAAILKAREDSDPHHRDIETRQTKLDYARLLWSVGDDLDKAQTFVRDILDQDATLINDVEDIKMMTSIGNRLKDQKAFKVAEKVFRHGLAIRGNRQIERRYKTIHIDIRRQLADLLCDVASVCGGSDAVNLVAEARELIQKNLRILQNASDGNARAIERNEEIMKKCKDLENKGWEVLGGTLAPRIHPTHPTFTDGSVNTLVDHNDEGSKPSHSVVSPIAIPGKAIREQYTQIKQQMPAVQMDEVHLSDRIPYGQGMGSSLSHMGSQFQDSPPLSQNSREIDQESSSAGSRGVLSGRPHTQTIRNKQAESPGIGDKPYSTRTATRGFRQSVFGYLSPLLSGTSGEGNTPQDKYSDSSRSLPGERQPAECPSEQPTSTKKAEPDSFPTLAGFLTAENLPKATIEPGEKEENGVWFDTSAFDIRADLNKDSKQAVSWMLDKDNLPSSQYLLRKAGPKEDAPENDDVKVAILDTGLDGKHPLLLPAPFGEDWGARVKDIISFDIHGNMIANRFRATSSEWQEVPWSQEGWDIYTDDDGHGTHVAGLVLQVAPNAEIYIAQVSRTRDQGLKPSTVQKAIEHAINIWKVDIISMSFGFEYEDNALKKTIEDHWGDAVIIAAAGNQGGNNHGIAFPANLDRVIGIKATDSYGNNSTFNTWGPGTFQTLGENVLSMWRSYKEKGNVILQQRSSGTSVATPIAAGIAALVLEFTRQPEDRNDGTGYLKLCRERINNDGRTEAMKRIFYGMSKSKGKGAREYRYIVPWNVLRAGRSNKANHSDRLMAAMELWNFLENPHMYL